MNYLSGVSLNLVKAFVVTMTTNDYLTFARLIQVGSRRELERDLIMT